jgi:GrpB-like predicted nucleotidyltransferase (UPF0157 family)
MGRIIEVKPHDVGWARAFEVEAAALSRVFGASLVAIHHVGSTSIQGLLAKPIIDILVVLNETETIDQFSGAMEGLGYRVRGECLDALIPGTPSRFYFTKDTGECARTMCTFARLVMTKLLTSWPFETTCEHIHLARLPMEI